MIAGHMKVLQDKFPMLCKQTLKQKEKAAICTISYNTPSYCHAISSTVHISVPSMRGHMITYQHESMHVTLIYMLHAPILNPCSTIQNDLLSVL